MATVEQLQAQLQQQRAAQAAEISAAEERIRKLQNDYELMQKDTDALEREERALQRQFGSGAASKAEDDEDSGKKKAPGFVGNVLKGLVDGEECKMKMRS